MENKIMFNPVGYIETKYDSRDGVPSQGQNAVDSTGTIVMYDAFLEGAKGFKVGSQLTVVFNFHKSEGYELTIVPFKEKVPTGVFSTRSPDRPNGIGITVVEITKIEGNRFDFVGADMINGTPILDMKPAIMNVVNFGSGKKQIG